jgi:hypothetical protein
VDTEADRRLDELGGPRRPQGQARGREREARVPVLSAAVLGARAGRKLAERGATTSVACGHPRRRRIVRIPT